MATVILYGFVALCAMNYAGKAGALALRSGRVGPLGGWLGVALALAFGVAIGLATTHAAGAALFSLIPPSPRAAAAAAIGAIGVLALNTVCGWPVSSTHALLGGCIGAALSVRAPVSALAWLLVLLPLLLTPLLAVVFARALDATLSTRPRVPPAWRARLHGVLMLLLATLAGFAQGPKLIALAQALSLSASPGLALIAGVCAFGGIRVAARLGSAWTAPADQPTAHAGLLAIGLTTVGLLGGWPLSLTHVLGGAIAGTAGGGLRPLYRAVLLAWCLTAPLAALLAALCALALAA